MKLGVVIFPSKKLQDLANSYRKRYDPHYSFITPHVTLKEPFETTEVQIKHLAKRLTKIAEDTQPFQLSVSKVSSFNPVKNVIYYKINPTEELEKLYNGLHTNFVGKQPEFGFVPHITIGQNLSKVEHADVYGSLRMMQLEHEEMVDRFHLLYQLENKAWTVYETFRFGNQLNEEKTI